MYGVVAGWPAQGYGRLGGESFYSRLNWAKLFYSDDEQTEKTLLQQDQQDRARYLLAKTLTALAKGFDPNIGIFQAPY